MNNFWESIIILSTNFFFPGLSKINNSFKLDFNSFLDKIKKKLLEYNENKLDQYKYEKN